LNDLKIKRLVITIQNLRELNWKKKRFDLRQTFNLNL
jgi:hypothetical protein